MLYDCDDAYLYDDRVHDLGDDSSEARHLEPLRKDGKAILAPHWVSTEEWRRIQNQHWYDELSPATAELLNPSTSTSRVLPAVGGLSDLTTWGLPARVLNRSSERFFHEVNRELRLAGATKGF